MVSKTVDLSGIDLNQRLDDDILAIERISILLEEAKVDPNLTLSMDRITHSRLLIQLAKYEELLEHLKATTEDTIDAIHGIVNGDTCSCGTQYKDDEPVSEDDDTDEY